MLQRKKRVLMLEIALESLKDIVILVSNQLSLNDNLHFCESFILILNGLILCSSKPLILTEIRIFTSIFDT
jgi:hypothetical protein